MIKFRCSRAILRLSLTAMLAFSATGCGHLSGFYDGDAAQDVAEIAAADGDLKLDEADIGSSGPAQIEAAIEALDAQAQRSLVTELGAAQTPGDAVPGDLFDRIRRGFSIDDVDHESVTAEERWFAKHPAYLDRTFKRGERYLYHIVNELEARRMPLELALLPVVESAFNPVAYSRARASGLWQFIPGTGRRYGLKQNWYYDGRRDVLAATTAALDYLEFLALEFQGDWLLAVAAYNAGENGVARAIARNRAAGKPVDFFSLKLPRETRAYVPKLLAMRRILANPGSHGLAFAPIADQPYFSKVAVAGQIDLNVAAELADVSKEELLALNPAFNNWVTDPEGPHHLLVPADREVKLVAALASLPPEKRVRVVYHTVRPGDTLSGIADKYGVSVATLRTSNKMRSSLIHPGQDLLITAAPRRDVSAANSLKTRLASSTSGSRERRRSPSSSRRNADSHLVRQGDTLWSIARSYGVSVDSIATRNGLNGNGTVLVGQVLSIPSSAKLASTNPASTSSASTTYTVRVGDTLGRIANRFKVSISELLGWNGLKAGNVIVPGQRLVLYVRDRGRAGI